MVDGRPVDIKLLVTELHRFSDYDYDNRSAIASLTTKAPRAGDEKISGARYERPVHQLVGL